MDHDINNQFSEKFLKSWEKLTTPDILRRNLVLASLYITAYETLKNLIVSRIKQFFTFDFTDGGEPILDKEYNNVKKLDRNIFIASCLWLQQNGAITTDDMADIITVREHRNLVAHQLLDILIDANQEINLNLLEKIRHLIQKIGLWWIREVDIPANSDFDGVQVEDVDIQSASMLLINLILGIVIEAKEATLE